MIHLGARTIVDAFSSREEHELIERIEDATARLMDGHQDGLVSLHSHGLQSTMSYEISNRSDKFTSSSISEKCGNRDHWWARLRIRCMDH